MADAYDPDREMIPIPGFGKKIEGLQRAGRYRTAIEEILTVLARAPGNQHALFLAAQYPEPDAYATTHCHRAPKRYPDV